MRKQAVLSRRLVRQSSFIHSKEDSRLTLYIKYITLTLLFVAVPALSETSSSFNAWIPKNWELIATATGDLNRDGIEDAVLILEQTDPANLVSNEGLGSSILNLNPRRLLILLKTPEGYQQALSRDNLLPSQNDNDAPCLADPLLEEGGISISDGKLMIQLGAWLSCGGWGVSHETFTFRLENARFSLIGYDYSTFARNSGEASEESINYLTGRRKTTTGLNIFGDSEPKVSWNRISGSREFYLDNMVFDCNPNDEQYDEYHSSCTWSR
ncbi:MAG: hypothetical protein LBV45_06370 [Xanthomonadaceae bacterium]|nr:hypothetical protein [Xanthomonadaceae bacterium]